MSNAPGPDDLIVFLDIETGHASDFEWRAFVDTRGPTDHDDDDRELSALTGMATIATIGVATIDQPPEVLVGDPFGAMGSDILFEAFRGWLREHVGRRRPWFVGWNIAGFDLPLLRQQAIRRGLPKMAAALGGGLLCKPWERRVVDLMDVWPVVGVERKQRGHRRQAEVCRRLGIPLQDGPLGSEMPKLIATASDPMAMASDRAAAADLVVRHQRADVVQLQALWAAMRGAL